MPKKQRERNRRGDGSVTVAKRDEKGRPILWKASISLGLVTIDGKRRRNRPTEYAETEAEAHELRKRLLAKHLMGEDLTPSKGTVGAAAVRWLAHIKVIRPDGTYRVYEGHYRNHIAPTIGGLIMHKVRTAHCQGLLDALAGTLAPSTIKDIRAILVKFFNDAKRLGDLPKNAQNPAKDTVVAPVVLSPPQSLTEAQLDRLLDTIAGDPMEPLIRLALAIGARISELLALLWSDVDEAADELRINGAMKRIKREGKQAPGQAYALVRQPYTKTRDQRIISRPAAAAEALSMQRERQKQQRQDAGKAWELTGLVFTDEHGRALNPNLESRHFKTIAKRAKLPPKFTFHSLRHSCATFLIKQGEQQRTIMKILGHKSERTTARYGVVLEEVARDALDRHSARLTRRRGAK